jgi:cell division protein FtsB
VLAAVFLVLLTLLQLTPAAKREWDYQRLRMAFIERQLEQTERAIAVKRQLLQHLHTDPDFIERVARERLRYLRPGDVLVEVEGIEKPGRP